MVTRIRRIVRGMKRSGEILKLIFRTNHQQDLRINWYEQMERKEERIGLRFLVWRAEWVVVSFS